jgi:ribonuclease HI
MRAVVTDEEGHVVAEWCGTGGTNNIAELHAVQMALTWAGQNGISEVEVRTDSRNNLSWILKPLGDGVAGRKDVLAIRSKIDSLREQMALTLVWVPRETNLAGIYLDRTAKS